VSEPELQGFKIGRTRLKPACGCEDAPIFFKESKPVLEVLFRRKNPTALVWFGAVNLYKIHNCLHKPLADLSIVKFCFKRLQNWGLLTHLTQP
jgi:hypothetical protein